MAGEQDILKNEIEVKIEGETFVFAIPSIMDDARMAARARAMRRNVDPEGDGGEYGFDIPTATEIRAAAAFETLLKKTSAAWVYTKAIPDGRPTIDASKFPLDKVNQIVAAYLAWQERVATFRNGGPRDQGTDSPEAVAGQPDSGDVAIQSGSAQA